MRDLSDVLQKIIPVTQNPQLKAELEDNLDSLLYAAPEMQGHWWTVVAVNIFSVIGELPKEDWEWKVASLLSGEPEADLRARLSPSSPEVPVQ